MSFKEVFEQIHQGSVRSAILAKTSLEVEHALHSRNRSFDDFLAFLSPAAEDYLEHMALASNSLTIQRFGRTIQLYAPIYVSNECSNACIYCGFSRLNNIDRITLNIDDVIEEGRALHDQGFRHILLLSGESPNVVSLDYLQRTVEKLHNMFSSISIEIYPMDTDSYHTLIDSGVDGLTIYQETYDKTCYDHIHPSGQKKNFDWRLDTPDRGGQAGFRRINIGALLGLSDWRMEGALLGLHADYLMKRYWESHISVSFPRLRPAAGSFEAKFPVNDAAMVQLICALRLWLPDAGLVLSTRESKELRDNLLPLGITQISAGSITSPGGYSLNKNAEEQFAVNDIRSPSEIAHMLKSRGYDPVWKDWDSSFLVHSS